jgi:multicomponent Na+:H+ antiporter subunit F
MIGSEITVAGAAATLTFGLLLVGMVGSFVRMVRGPSLPDRVVALDMLTVLMVAFAGVFVVATGRAAFLDVAIVLALVGFLGTVAFARYAERRDQQRPNPLIDKE